MIRVVFLCKKKNFSLIFVLNIILFSAPFCIAYNYIPFPTFYTEFAATSSAVILAFVIFLKSKVIAISSSGIACLSFAIFLLLQIFILNIRIPGINLAIAFEFVVAGFISIAITSYVAYNEKTQKHLVLIIAYAVLIGTTIQTIYGYLQFAGIAAKLPQLILYAGSMGDAIIGNIGQKGDYDCFLLLGVFALIYLFAKSKINLITFSLYQLFYLIIITITGARSVFLVLIFIIIASVSFLKLHKDEAEKNTLNSTRSFVFATVITVAIYMLLQIFVPLSFNYLMHNTHVGNTITGLNPNLLSGSRDYSQINSALHRFTDKAKFSADGSYRRIYEWYKALYLFGQHPFFGIGWFQYPRESVYLMETARFMSIPEYEDLFSNPHNIILEVLAETGIVGFIIIIGFGVFYSFYRIFKNFSNLETLFIAFMLLDIFIFSQVEYPLWYAYFLIYFVLFLSIDKPMIMFKNNKTTKTLIATASVLIILILECGCFTYNKLVFYTAFIPQNINSFGKNVHDLEHLIKDNPLWAYPALKTLSFYINPDFAEISEVMPIKEQIYYREKVTQEFPSPTVLLRQIILDKVSGNEMKAIYYAILLAHAYPGRRQEMIQNLQIRGGFLPEIEAMQSFDYHEQNTLKIWFKK